jgi:hypothetical protein
MIHIEALNWPFRISICGNNECRLRGLVAIPSSMLLGRCFVLVSFEVNGRARSLSDAHVSCCQSASRLCLQANSVRLMWNALGTAVLAETASDTDATNQSYYGETKLHFLVCRPRKPRFVTL